MQRRRSQSPAWMALAAGIFGCSGPRTEFLEGRVQDRCDDRFNVCATVAGCALGPGNYIEGTFPSTRKLVTQLLEPSKVRVHVYLEDVSFSGDQTVFRFYEEGCRQLLVESSPGQSFVAEANQGTFFEEVTLTGKGDHLIEVQSDAAARYFLKVDVEPLRDTELEP